MCLVSTETGSAKVKIIKIKMQKKKRKEKGKESIAIPKANSQIHTSVFQCNENLTRSSPSRRVKRLKTGQNNQNPTDKTC